VPERQAKLQNLARTLNALSPLPTLTRGYAIVTDARSGAAITTIGNVTAGQALVTQLHDGQIHSSVGETNNKTLGSK
jgi:exodeoxyribonuclease VII large subunit